MGPALSREEAEARIFAMHQRYAAEIRDAYQEAELRVLEKLAKRIDRGIESVGWAERKYAELQKFNREIGNELQNLRKLDPKIQEAVEKAYSMGADRAAAELVQSNVTDMAAEIGTGRAAGVRTLVETTVGAVRNAQLPILRSANDAYREVVAQASRQVLIGSQTRREAAQVALNRLADQGILTFRDKRGRNWDLSSYVEMSVRSSTAQASIQGHADKLVENGNDLAIISDSPEECELCRPWEGVVVSLTGTTPGYPSLDEAVAEGLFHANCTHTTSIYIEGVTRPYTNTANPDGYKERQQQRYNERQIRHWKKREAVANTDQAKQFATAKRKEWQGRQREFIEETGRRRDYGRESITRAR